MHIPKTAGTALRSAFSSPGQQKLRVFPHYDERLILDANPADFDVFSGHYGFKTASRLEGDIITVLRHPVERFVSVYYFWRALFDKKVDVGHKTKLTKLYSLEDFVCLQDEWLLMEEFFNRMTWQVAHGSATEHWRWRSAILKPSRWSACKAAWTISPRPSRSVLASIYRSIR
jgi:hypothetical protein